MVKVFLVEDESIIRKSIRENIQWEREGFDFVGEAPDGELALPLIRETKPDILITDVKMPFMDGLELSALVKKELPAIKIIILSGFRDFDFAKKAITIGVMDYLSKPITSERLLATIRQVKERIEEEREDAVLRETFQKEMKDKMDMERNQFLNHLLLRKESVPDLITAGEKLGLNLVSPLYAIVLCKFLTSEDNKENEEASSNAYRMVKERLSKETKILSFERGFDGIALLAEGGDEAEIQSLVNLISTTIGSACPDTPCLHYYGGIGETVCRLSELPKSYQSANRAFSSRFFGKTNQIIHSGKESATVADPSALRWGNLEKFLSIGTIEEVPGFVEKYIDTIGEESCQGYSFATYVAMNAFYCVCALPFIAQLPKDQRDEKSGTAPLSIQGEEALRHYLENLFDHVLAERDSQVNRRYSQQIEKAKRYITDHVEDYGLSLNTVAEHIHMSPNYFSTIFSQEAGKTFIEFLTEARMQRAKELLASTDERPSDIAVMVGYQDSHYFGYLFKKLTGMTPKEYRDLGRKEK